MKRSDLLSNEFMNFQKLMKADVWYLMYDQLDNTLTKNLKIYQGQQMSFVSYFSGMCHVV